MDISGCSLRTCLLLRFLCNTLTGLVLNPCPLNFMLADSDGGGQAPDIGNNEAGGRSDWGNVFEALLV